MTSTAERRSIVVGRIACPAILIAIAFAWFYWIPTQRLIHHRGIDLEKRIGIAAESLKAIPSVNAKLASLQTEMAAIAAERQQVQIQTESLTAQPWRNASSPVEKRTAAKAVASTLDLLRCNGLDCIESGWNARLHGKEQPSIPTASNVPVHPTNQSANSTANAIRESMPATYRIRLLGRFDDVRRALAALQSNLPSVLVLTIDMELSQPLSDQRAWTLHILP